MKTARCVIVMSLFLLCMTQALADVPRLMNYQGRLYDSASKPVNAVKVMTFRFYDAETGGSLLAGFAETQYVAVTKGIFNVLIGSATVDGVPAEIFTGSSVYLSVTIGGEEQLPRQRLVSAAFAMKAAEADHAAEAAHAAATDADTVDGAHASELAKPADVAAAVTAHAGSGDHDSRYFTETEGDGRFVNAAGDTVSGALTLSIGSTGGITFPFGYGGDAGDRAWFRYYPSGRGATAMNLELGIDNDANDQLYLTSSGGVFIPSGGLNVTGNLTASGNAYASKLLDKDDSANFYLDPNGSSRVNDLTVAGTLTASIAPGTFDNRYLRKDADLVQNFAGILVNTKGANYLHPSAMTGGWGAIASQVFCSRNYYGADSTCDIYVGEQNPVYVGGSLRTPVMYDMDDINFYVNPSAVSVLNRIDANTFYDRSDTAFYVDPSSTTILNDVRGDRFYSRQNTGYYVDPDGMSILSILAADVFYDRGDASYYVDPGSISNVYRVKAATFEFAAQSVSPIGAGRLYQKTDGRLYYRDVGGAEHRIAVDW